MKRVFVVVDMQNDFVSGALGSVAARNIVPRVRERLAEERAHGSAVAFTQDTHGADYLNTPEGKRLPVPHCLRGTSGWQIVDGLDTTGAHIVEKTAFASVELAEYVAGLAPEEVALVGLCTDICVISNAMLVKAFCPNARVTVYADSCAGATEEGHRTALQALRPCQIDVIE